MKRSNVPRNAPDAAATYSPVESNPLSIDLILIAFAGLLAVIFLSQRGEDLGTFPGLLQSFLASLMQKSLLSLEGLMASSGGALTAALIVAAWYGAGEAVWSLLHKLRAMQGATEDGRENPALRFAQRCATGAGLWSLVWFALGTAGLYRRASAVITLLAGLLLTVLAVKTKLQGKTTDNEAIISRTSRSAAEIIALIVITASLLLGLIVALAPPTAKDALLYHIALPKAYLAAGGLVNVEGNVAGYLAHGAEMHGMWAMLLGGFINQQTAEAAFGATQFAFFPLLLLLIYGWALALEFQKTHALIATAMFAAIPTAYHVAGSGYADNALALYIALAVQAAGSWWQTGSRRALVTLSFFLGCALTIKLTALFAGLFLGVLFLLKARKIQNDSEAAHSQTVGKELLSGTMVLLMAGVIASPWYVKTWMATGSPVFPFYMNLWPGQAPGWDENRSFLFQLMNANYGGENKGLADYLLTPFKLSLMAQPESHIWYDGVLGISFLCGVPLILWAIRKKRLRAELKIAAAIAGGWFFCWMFSSQQLRYLLPALPGLAVGIVGAAVALSGRPQTEEKGDSERVSGLALTLLLTTVAGLWVTLAWFLMLNPLRVVTGGESRQAYLERRLDYYPYYQIVNTQLPQQARVWLINMRRDSYHIERSFFSDYLFEDYTLTNYVREAADVQSLRLRVKADGITHVLIRTERLLDYAYSPIVDERKPEAENQQKLQLLRAFLTEGTRIIRQDQKFMLVDLQ